MKNSIVKIYFLLLLFIVTVIGCNDEPEDKAKDMKAEQENVKQKNEAAKKAEIELQNAKDEYNQAIIDSTNEYNNYRNDIIIRINDNDMRIAKMMKSLKKENSEVKAKFEMQMVELNEQNNKLKTKINNYNNKTYNNKTYNNWQKFKISFNQEMDDLGKSISEMAKND